MHKSDNPNEEYKTRDIEVTVADKIAGCIAIVGALFVIVKMFLPPTSNSNDLFVLLIIFLMVAIDAFIPEIPWWLEKLRTSLHVQTNDKIMPSSWYLFARKLIIFVLQLAPWVILFKVD